MMKYLTLFLVVVFLSGNFGAEIRNRSRSLTGYKVIRADVTTKEGAEALDKLQLESNFDFWSDPKIGHVDIMTSPEQISELQNILKSHGIHHYVWIEDVKKLVHEESELVKKSLVKSDGRMDWETYHRYDDILVWLEELAATNSHVTLEVIGQSFENRDLKVAKVSNGGVDKKAVWIDGGVHAREWASPAVVSYILDQLAKLENAQLLEQFEFHVLVSANPDGYEFTHNHEDNRFWRKTRSDYGHPDPNCRGADPNRNFGEKWGGPGASLDPCSEIYRGPNAWSELEVAAIRDYIINSGASWHSYVSIHTYGQYWMTPWGFTNALPANYEELKTIADKCAAAIELKHGTKYTTGSITNLLNAAAGGSVDWSLAPPINIKYSFALELRDKGEFGFVLPQDQIIPTAEETWDGIKELLNQI